MKLTILGSGTCVPSLTRGAPSNHLSIGNKQILIDCGVGALLQLEKANLSYKEIDIVCISHYHPDHIANLSALIHSINWAPGFNRKKDLTLIGPVGFNNFYDSYIKPVSGSPKPNSYKLVIKEIDNTINFDTFNIQSCNTNHNDDSIAYKFTESNKKLVISGDTDYDETLIKFSKDADTLVLECSFPNNNKIIGHLIPNECSTIATDANVNQLILNHLYPPISGKVRLLETQQGFTNTILAEDLMEIII